MNYPLAGTISLFGSHHILPIFLNREKRSLWNTLLKPHGRYDEVRESVTLRPQFFGPAMSNTADIPEHLPLGGGNLSAVTGRIAGLGALVTDSVTELGSIAQFGLRTLRWLLTRLPKKETISPNFYQIGVLSLPVVALTGTFIGMVLAVQSYSQFRMLHLESRLGAVINMSLVRELGPVLAATMLAGRVGSAMAAELGTMRVTEQIDALASMGANPIHYLVVPRFLGCLLLIPALTIMADFMGVVGGAFYGVYLLGIDWHHYWTNSRGYVSDFDLFAGVFKSLFFGAAIALISCHRGFHCDPGAEGVGRAATTRLRLFVRHDPAAGPGPGHRPGQAVFHLLAARPEDSLTWSTHVQPIDNVRATPPAPLLRLENLSVDFQPPRGAPRHRLEHRPRRDLGDHRRERLRQDGAVEDDHRPVAAQRGARSSSTGGTWPTRTSGN